MQINTIIQIAAADHVEATLLAEIYNVLNPHPKSEAVKMWGLSLSVEQYERIKHMIKHNRSSLIGAHT